MDKHVNREQTTIRNDVGLARDVIRALFPEESARTRGLRVLAETQPGVGPLSGLSSKRR
jgi:hypothetical protein